MMNVQEPFFFTFRTEKNNMVEMGHSLWWAEEPCTAKAMAHSVLPRLLRLQHCSGDCTLITPMNVLAAISNPGTHIIIVLELLSC